ncbi:polysaccharide deacetylase family protein [Staphylococcus saprophyticus]|uniref:polysaccharide deacetylase family protein n=1 Tax=Staphylococcus saprophyticus TaxID=29385 RepID=UPI0019D17405|nr:polysaccharide deacetylase family protein [Staphylococcus saprophyticus]MBN6203940.1 polysaccharide deacetylase family protein [Staphylococcus saprophyticus]
MGRKNIDAFWDRNNVLNVNDNFLQLFEDVLNVKNVNSTFISDARKILDDAKKYNFDNVEVQKQLNNLIIESGNANAEVSQARNYYDVLGERLNNELIRSMEAEAKGNRSIIATSKRKFPMITFIDDDGRTEVLEKWEPILKEKGNKLTIPLITGWMDDPSVTNVITWEDVHRLKKEYGVEFVSHTHTHCHGNQMTAQQIDDDLRDAKRVLQREGLSHDIIVQPYGENSDDVRKISRDYAKINISTKEFVNTTPLDTFRVGRISLGEDLYTTFAQYKEKLDEAIANNGWIIFKSHSQYPSFNENQQQLIRQIIDYARANNIAEVSVDEGISYFGNLIDVGDYTARAKDKYYYVLDRDGEVHSNYNSKDFWNYKFNSVGLNTPVTQFKEGTTSTVSIISTNAQGFPDNAPGQLITFRSESITLSYQLYLPSDSDTIFKRRWDENSKKWLTFKKIVTDVAEHITRQYTPSTVVPPNSSVNAIISNAQLDALAFKAGDLIVGSPEINIVDGISYNINISENNKINVKFTNATTTQKTVNATYFNFKISKVK